MSIFSVRGFLNVGFMSIFFSLLYSHYGVVKLATTKV